MVGAATEIATQEIDLFKWQHQFSFGSTEEVIRLKRDRGNIHRMLKYRSEYKRLLKKVLDEEAEAIWSSFERDGDLAIVFA
jgi:hypothetical protein